MHFVCPVKLLLKEGDKTFSGIDFSHMGSAPGSHLICHLRFITEWAQGIISFILVLSSQLEVADTASLKAWSILSIHTKELKGKEIMKILLNLKDFM